MSREIKHRVLIKAAPQKVFAALLDSRKHAQFTGEPAKISRKVGGTFHCYDHYIDGLNLEIVPNQLIVQAWRSRNWPKGTFSIVTFHLVKKSRRLHPPCLHPNGSSRR